MAIYRLRQLKSMKGQCTVFRHAATSSSAMYKYTKTTTGIEYVNYVTLLTNNKNIKKCIIFDYDLRGYEGLEGLC